MSLIAADRSALAADFLIQMGYATEIHFHGKRYPWFVSDVTMKDWAWLLNSMTYGNLFPKATPQEIESLRLMGKRWKVCGSTFPNLRGIR